MLRTILLCCLFWKLVTHTETYVQQFIEDTLQQLCPGENFCQNHENEDLTGDSSTCCLKCTCDETCSELGTCCPNKDRTKGDKAELHCVGTDIKRFPGKAAEKSYRIINKCPDTEENAELTRNCSSTNLTSLQKSTWVSERQSGKIYQNQFCATCHGVDANSYVYWGVSSDCPEAFNEDYTVDIDDILHKCPEIIMVAPNEVKGGVSKYRCFPPDFSTCNETGLWKTYNESIDSACLSFLMPFFKQGGKSRKGVKVFRNVYCYMCNFNANLKVVPQDCPVVEELFSKSSWGPRFSILLDTNEYLKETAGDEKNACRVDEIYDPYLKICHRLKCPFGNRAYYGKCKSLFAQTKGVAIKVSYRLRVLETKTAINLENSGNYTNDQMRKEFGLAAYKKFKKMLNFDDTTCQMCLEHVLMPSTNRSGLRGGYQVILSMSTNVTCHAETIFVKYLSVFGKRFTVRKNSYGYLSLEVMLDKRNVEVEVTPDTILWKNGSVIKFCALIVQLISEEICPNIDMNYLHVLRAPESRARSAALSLFKQNGNTRNHTDIEICVEKYFSYMSVNGQVNCTRSQSVAIVYLLSLVLTFWLARAKN